MTAIERTAYPRFKQQPTCSELAEFYTPTPEEMAFAQSQSVSKIGRLRILVLGVRVVSEPKRTLSIIGFLYQLNLSRKKRLKPLMYRSNFLCQLALSLTGTSQ